MWGIVRSVILPALEEGIHAIHYAEGQSVSLDVDTPRIDSLEKLERLLLVSTTEDGELTGPHR